MRKNKIAILSFYSGTIERGAETFVYELANRLLPEYEVHVYQQGKIKPTTNFKTKEIKMKVNWDRKDMTNTLARRFFVDYWSRCVFLFSLRTLGSIFKNRYDIVIPIDGGWEPALARLLTWIYGGKVVIVGESGIGWDDRNNLWSFPDRFVAISRKAYKWAKRAQPLVNTVYIPNGVDVKKFNPLGTKLSLKLEKPIILSVGALVGYKNIPLVINAVAKLKKGSLLVVGDGEKFDEIKDLGEKLLGKRFKLTRAKFSEMPSVYRSGDVFCLVPDTSEAFGNVYIEAMACGLPVVAIDDEQRREIIGSAGLYAQHDAESVTKALEKALTKKWNNVPRIQAEKYSWEIISKEYKTLFGELID